MGFWVVFFVVVFCFVLFQDFAFCVSRSFGTKFYVLICMALELPRKHLLNTLVARPLKNYP